MCQLVQMQNYKITNIVSTFHKKLQIKQKGNILTVHRLAKLVQHLSDAVHAQWLKARLFHKVKGAEPQ